jgi:hypothetical protein
MASSASAAPSTAAGSRVDFPFDSSPPTTVATAQVAQSNCAVAKRLTPEAGRFKRCAEHLSQFQKSNVNAHSVDTHQTLQIFLHFLEVVQQMMSFFCYN